MVRPSRVWFFDLDGTLYTPMRGLWPAVGARIEAFLQQALHLEPAPARALRQRYIQQYGTTLHGLRAEHPEIDPLTYLTFVGQVPVEDFLQPDPRLRQLLASLPGPKWIFTNADAPYARRVLHVLGVTDAFDGIIDIIALNFAGKPWPEAYARALHLAQAPRERAVLLDDQRANIEGARAVGWRAIWVHPQAQSTNADEIPHIYALPQVLSPERAS